LFLPRRSRRPAGKPIDRYLRDAARAISHARAVTARLWIAGLSWSLSLSLSVLACAHGAATAPLANQGHGPPATEIRAIDWENHTYQLDELGAVTVRAGQADFGISDDNKAVELGTSNGSYTVAHPLFADVNGDGVDDAIIWSVLATGGTGHFSEIRIYTLRGGKVAVLAQIPGGDRGEGGIRHVALEGAALIVDRNVLAEGDGMCCASAAQRERWIWKGNEMVEDTAARKPITP
jgi:hypothetical protein